MNIINAANILLYFLSANFFIALKIGRNIDFRGNETNNTLLSKTIFIV
jgi:hypothetical protein